MSTLTRALPISLSFFALTLGAGCDSNACTTGQQAMCSCSDGRSGSQTCRTDGTFDPCICAGSPDAGSAPDAAHVDAGASDASNDAMVLAETGTDADLHDAANVDACVATTEVCDGMDNDCDGTVDNGDPGGGVTCNTAMAGVCATGTTACTSGALTCVATHAASAEVCDGMDNDCDGTVDNGNPGGGGACNTGMLGVCATGVITCASGALSCVATHSASAETCNGMDDNCNGTVDEGDPGGGAACNTGRGGACAAGLITCSATTLTCVATGAGC